MELNITVSSKDKTIHQIKYKGITQFDIDTMEEVDCKQKISFTINYDTIETK